jgi:hypothetical protein
MIITSEFLDHFSGHPTFTMAEVDRFLKQNGPAGHTLKDFYLISHSIKGL